MHLQECRLQRAEKALQEHPREPEDDQGQSEACLHLPTTQGEARIREEEKVNYMARKRKMGIGEVLMIAGALRQASNNTMFDYPIVRQINGLIELFPHSNNLVQAGGSVLVYEYLRKEANKEHLNPDIGPFKMF